MNIWRSAPLAAALLVLPSCARVTVEPIEVKPIHITMDINIKIQRELAKAFDFEKDFESVKPQDPKKGPEKK